MSTPPNLSPDETRTIRLGFVSSHPLENQNHLSGMPSRMARSLAGQGFQIVPLIEFPNAPARKALPIRILRRLRSETKRRFPQSLRNSIERCLSQRTRNKLIRQIEKRSGIIQHHLDHALAQGEHIDAIFGCCISSTLYALRTNLPIIYFSDATSYLIRDTYASLKSRGPIHLDTLHHIEQTSVKQSDAAIFASPITRDSAINDLHINPHLTHVVPMGAHVTPDNPASVQAPSRPPTRDNCQLLIVAAEPIRKRVDLAVAATQVLRNRGINATLHVVGPGTPTSRSNESVKSHGRLRLDDPSDRRAHQQLLRDCHIQLLPSLGEAFGIAPIESAHFARPSIVSSAGGLPFVVLHDRTGLVINRDDDATAWADAIESLIDNPDRYRSMSTAALKRARAELNWDAWGRSVAQIIRQTIAEHT